MTRTATGTAAAYCSGHGPDALERPLSRTATAPPGRTHPQVTTPVDLLRLAAAGPPCAGRTRVIAVDGPSGSGKTLLATRLARLLGDAPVVHLDDLYAGWDGLEAAPPRAAAWVLAPLADPAGHPGLRRWDWARGGYREWHPLPPDPEWLIFEGVGSGAQATARYATLLVWLEAPEEVRFARAMARDGETFRPHWRRWAEQERVHFARERTRERATMVLDTGGTLPPGAARALLVGAGRPGD